MYNSGLTLSMTRSKSNGANRLRTHFSVEASLKKILSGLVLLTFVVMIVRYFPLFSENVLLPLRVICMDVVPYVWQETLAWLTPPFLFCILNMMLIAILMPSGLFHLGKSAVADVSNVKQVQAGHNADSVAEVSQEMEPTHLSCLLLWSEEEKLRSEMPFIDNTECFEPLMDTTDFQEADSHDTPHADFDVITSSEENMKIEARSSFSPSIGHEDALCCELDDLHERIEAFIAHARKQMRSQDPYVSTLDSETVSLWSSASCHPPSS